MANMTEIKAQYTKLLQSGALSVEPEKRMKLSEALTTNDLNIVMPKAMELIMLDAAEPEYLASKFVKNITITEGKTLDFINFGALRASEIAEGQDYPEQQLNAARFGGKASTEVKVKKYGMKIPITEEMVTDSQWDVVGMHLQAAGRAMARKQEEVIFEEFSKHGHTVFDADTGGEWSGSTYVPNASGLAPTGRGWNGEFNGTLTAQDFIDMCVSIMASGFNPTDVIMHPLCYSLFRNNEVLSSALVSAAAFGGNATGSIDMNVPASGAYRLPLTGLSVYFSPYVKFSHADKKFDVYIIDRNNAGVLVNKEGISIDQFSDPARDILNLKIKARYGVGVINGGLGIAVAKNIRFAKTWPMAGREFAAMPMPSDMTNANMDLIQDRSVLSPTDPAGPA